VIRLSAGAGLASLSGVAFGASDFWNRKPAADWSEKEIAELKTHSPWAKKVRAELTGGFGGPGGREGAPQSMDRSGSRGSFGGISGADSNGISEGGGGGRGGGGGGRGGAGGGGDFGGGAPVPQGPEVVVRWESAQPVVEALRIKLPDALANHYAVSVTGLPPQMLVMMLNRGRGRGETPPPEDPAERQKALIDRLAHSASLSAKGHDPEVAELVLQTQSRETLIFGFRKESLRLTPTDKDVQFVMKLGALTVKAKFEPKEMMYKGDVSV